MHLPMIYTKSLVDSFGVSELFYPPQLILVFLCFPFNIFLHSVLLVSVYLSKTRGSRWVEGWMVKGGVRFSWGSRLMAINRATVMTICDKSLRGQSPQSRPAPKQTGYFKRKTPYPESALCHLFKRKKTWINCSPLTCLEAKATEFTFRVNTIDPRPTEICWLAWDQSLWNQFQKCQKTESAPKTVGRIKTVFMHVLFCTLPDGLLNCKLCQKTVETICWIPFQGGVCMPGHASL